MTSQSITHALISVSNKTGIIEFAKELHDLNIKLLSTGGTAKLLRENSIPVIEISDFTEFPEIFNGRVKTLHPKIYAGILARPELDQDILKSIDTPIIGLVIVNLYPFEEIIAKRNHELAAAIEHIDIGGSTLLRAAAKNYQYITAVVSENDYTWVLSELKQNKLCTLLKTRFELAKKVFAHTAKYDAAISNYLSSYSSSDQKMLFPEVYTEQFLKKSDLRYGENPHQQAAFYVDSRCPKTGTIANVKQQAGKPLSFNNIADADTALECVKQFQEPACVIVKHANPCAVAVAGLQLEAYKKAYEVDPSSAFGGIIAFNTSLECQTIEHILANQFAELLIIPDIRPETLQVAEKKPSLRILTVGTLSQFEEKTWDFKRVNGGLLIQDYDHLPSPLNIDIVSKKQPSPEQLEDLLFAWKVIRFVKSNAVLYAKNKITLGIGAGQTSRVFSAKIATMKAQEAGLALQGSVMASDAFFPFRDSIDQAAEMGISAIIQPGGSIRDKEVIQAADEYDIAMIFTHIRHFRH